jgi:hypothetical protein
VADEPAAQEPKHYGVRTKLLARRTLTRYVIWQGNCDVAAHTTRNNVAVLRITKAIEYPISNCPAKSWRLPPKKPANLFDSRSLTLRIAVEQIDRFLRVSEDLSSTRPHLIIGQNTRFLRSAEGILARFALSRPLGPTSG